MKEDIERIEAVDDSGNTYTVFEHQMSSGETPGVNGANQAAQSL